MSEIITNKKDLRKGIDSLIDLYFSQPKVLYSHLFSSYHQFVEEMIPYSLEEETNYFYDNVTNDAIYLYGFKFEDTKILPPVRERDNEIIFPQMARKNFLNYFANINTKVTQFQEKVNLHTGEITRRNIGDPEEMVVASIPVMVKSKYCATSLKPETSKYECKYDPGGYFIVGGQEKVVVSIEKMIDNKILVFSKSDSSFPKGKMYTSQINSRKHDWSENLQIIAIRNNKDDSLIITTSQLVEIPIMVLLRALGIENDRELIARITNNLDDIPMVNLLRNSLENSVDDNGNLIKTREEAINFLMTKMKAGRRISQSDEQVAQAQKKLLLEKIITKDLLPHLGADIPGKASFICLMVKKILLVMLGRKQEDDRDAFENKRVETPGVLLGQLFRQNFNKMLKEIGKLFRRKNNSDETPINMVSQITPTTIEQGIKSGLATGIWGVSKTKAGAAQSLSRLTWLQTISYLRRIKSPNMDTSTSKITSIRQINNVQAFFVCNVETPEGQPIGLAKSLSMMATITPRLESQTELINKLIEEHPKMYHPFAVNPEDINNMIKIFHNGSWKGVLDIKEGYSFFENLKKMRRNSKINKFVTITLDYFEKDLYIYTEAGRLIRPLLKVDDNEIKLTKTIVADIKKHLTGDKKSSGWNQILLKYPDLVDYEDIESSRHLMFAMDMQMLLENKANSLRDINTKEEIIKPNRYGKFRYVNYTHSEFHPSMMLGTIVSTVPFINHNPSPRGIIFFSQAKQAIGIYSTAYKDRMDISNILYHPQVPLVGTKASKYNRFDDIPSGENIIVAIMSYKGYNVEDSIMINQTSLDRGLFRADSLRKYSSKIEKNPSSSQDDIFMKPDRNKVTGMTRGNYEKLNEKGYIPEETPVTSNDILIGKVSPIQPTSDNKVYKDKSELFKSNVDGVVDRVHKDIFNNDGYEMISMRVRMERPPIIGDKFCQKYDTLVLTHLGWIKLGEIDITIHKVATLDKHDNIIYVYPTSKFEFDYDGDFYEHKNNSIDIECTINHKLYCKYNLSSSFTLIPADKVYGNKVIMKNMENEVIWTDPSKEQIHNYKGKVYCIEVPDSHIYYMKTSSITPPVWIGNSTKHGQKGTVGITLPQRDMPFTSEGMTPDLIFNPHGMPTRMTMGQLAETLASKAAANIGELFDGTPFSDYDVTEIPKVLKELGMDEYGTEEMYCGMTGRKMKARIFIGPMFYLRLKHMVLDKVHSRSMGPRQAITRQPMEGRSKDGGLKIGEMEKDAMVAHGIGQFLKERMMENSDITTIMVCDKCGTFATKVMDKEYYVCNNCNNHTDFSNVAMPYAFKLMVQELTAVNILPRIRAEKIDL
ncbi:putative DNA-directed RNA polymerase subunit Rpb2 precursor [Cafeteria roenbergensis virus]|uniref:DNA-directed RNA polymerase n=2 Tax=Cafeteria roenbergensis virus (strain BV-PW1) TaxID=693272 RepID=E3T4Z4_CROVB|nr:putative DNA-directed RNA polymerase subunit Rpb2 precursor [Cafeteria roenbergensis virus BV-PW1]ADO67257.1 putative DNA-directed RNA polymerase subunit Rpb2 precursor [Cafeteria roenbergensis virus BV-PW1]